MSNLLILVKNDLKNVLRDKALYIILFVPFIFIIIINIGLPILFKYLPQVKQYGTLIMAFTSLITAIMPAYVMAFVTLDEKDQQIVPALRILPFSFEKFIGYRLIFLLSISFIFVFVTLVFTNLLQTGIITSMLLAFSSSFIAPFSYLAIILLAKNKIEGVTYFKLINTLFALPIIAFFIDSPYTIIAGALPVYWTFQTFIEVGNILFYQGLGISIFYHLLLILFLYKKCLNNL